MIHADYCRALSAEAGRFVVLLPDADPAIPIPTCPGWDLATLAGHVGATHRWVTAMLESQSTVRLPYRLFAGTIPADTSALPGWVEEGAAKLISSLASAPPERQVWAWGPDQSVRFWSRRMLHEIAIHRADAALALGKPVAIADSLADDGVDEFLTNLPHAHWVPGVAAIVADRRTLALAALDTHTVWQITLDPRGMSWCRGGVAAGADVVASAPLNDLYLFAWGRVPIHDVTGDADLLARWTAATAL